MSKLDPHKAWLQELRSISVRLSGGIPDEQPGTVPGLKTQVFDLQNQIIDTAPTGKGGVLAQVDLLQDFAWSDPIRRLARNLSLSIKQLWPE